MVGCFSSVVGLVVLSLLLSLWLSPFGVVVVGLFFVASLVCFWSLSMSLGTLGRRFGVPWGLGLALGGSWVGSWWSWGVPGGYLGFLGWLTGVEGAPGDGLEGALGIPAGSPGGRGSGRHLWDLAGL